MAIDEVILENERLENLFKNMKPKKEDFAQIKYKIIELYGHVQDAALSNAELRLTLLRRSANLIFKLSLSKSTDISIAEQFLRRVVSFLMKCAEKDHQSQEAWSSIIRNIFQIFTYKHTKRFSQILVDFCTFLLKTRKFTAVFKANSHMLVDFLRKGKEIDKIFFTCEKLLLASDELSEFVLADLVEILVNTRNTFYIKYCPLMLSKFLQKWNSTNKELEGKFIELLIVNKKALHIKAHKNVEESDLKYQSLILLLKKID